MRLMKASLVLKSIFMIFIVSLASFSFADSEIKRIEKLEAAVSALEKRISALEDPSTQSPSGSPKLKSSGGWKNKSNWRELSKSMTKDQVKSILGEPDKIDAAGPFENWYWNPPFGPNVIFHEDILYGWDER